MPISTWTRDRIPTSTWPTTQANSAWTWSNSKGWEQNLEPEPYGKSATTNSKMKKYRFYNWWAKLYNWQLTKIFPLKNKWRCFWPGELFTDNAVIESQLNKDLETAWLSAKMKVLSNRINQPYSQKAIFYTNYPWWNLTCCNSNMILCFLWINKHTHLKISPNSSKIGSCKLYKSGKNKVQGPIKLYSAT